MSFWVGLVIIVLLLEVVRIGLSSFLLLHILRGIQPPSADAPELHATSRARADWARERDRLASEALVAVRQAMDGRAAPDAKHDLSTAITALDAYVLHHVNEGRA